MLSILIPIYNVKIVKLVDELKSQCMKANVAFEIICLDDRSAPRYRQHNQAISGVLGVNYVELSENIGRARIRNRLAKLARYEHLLYIDADSKMRSRRYIKRYLDAIRLGQRIVYGGRKYTHRRPKPPKLLHWLYGSEIECPPADQRAKRSTELFHTNNFVISRAIILEHPFDEEINHYGYEDIEIGQRWSAAGHAIHHIDNPIYHTGLKKTESFLKDIDQSIDNLATLYRSDQVTDTRLIRHYDRLQQWGLIRLTRQIIDSRLPSMIKNLSGARPRLLYLQLYKLHHFINAVSTDQQSTSES